MAEFLDAVDGFLWGMPFIIFVLVIGLYYTLRSGLFSIIHLHYIMKNTIGNRSDSEKSSSDGTISSFAAVAIAIGGTVGAGNLAGVATAVATGGPGSVFGCLYGHFLE